MPFRAIADAHDDEKLREALVELERARAREQQARGDASTLLEAMEAMTRAPSPTAAIAALLDRVSQAFHAEAAAILLADSEGFARVAHATEPTLIGARWREAAPRLAKPRRLIEFDHARLGAPEAMRPYRSLMSTPLRLEDREMAALACFSRDRADFSVSDLQFLGRLGGLATQALAAQRLWERHGLLAGVIEGSVNALAIFDARGPDHACVYVNPAFERLTGYASAHVVGLPWRRLCLEWLANEDAATRDALQDAIDGRRSGALEVRNRRRDGSRYWARVNLFPVSGEDGVVRHIVATQADITEQRKAQIERDAARAQLDSALSSTNQGFAVLGPGGDVAYVNAAFENFFPTPEGWRAGADFAHLWGAFLATTGADRDAALIEGRRRRDWAFSGDVSKEVALTDGRTILVSATRTRDHGAVVTAADVTATKRAESLLTERAAAIDAAQDGIALTDSEGRFRYMNPSHLAMFGFETQSEIVGMSWEALYEEDAKARLMREAFPELGRSGAWRGEALGRRRDGAPMEQEVALTLLPDGGMVCVTRDISERRRHERERMRLREEVQTAQRREAVGQIAAGVAHDFNNLLAAISGSAELAASTLDAGAPARPHLDRIARAAESGAELMGRLLGLGARDKRRIRLDLAEPLRQAADLVSAGAGLAVSVETDLPETPVMADADPGDVLHLALNLGVNARDALGAEGGRITLALRAANANDLARKMTIGSVDPTRAYAVISVEDEGKGVPPELVNSIFKPHVSTKGDAGTGLGLAIVAGVLAENDAALALTSEPEKGALFEIFWPLIARTDVADAHVASGSLDGATILLAEDSPETLATLAAFLERAGAEVAPCENPYDAAEAIEDDPDAWDLLITDLEMPGLDGAALSARARKVAPSLPMILCTGAADLEVSAVRGAFDAVLRKPVSEASLIAAARRALASKSTGED